MESLRWKVGTLESWNVLAAVSLSIFPSFHLSAQSVESLAVRFAAMTAVTGYEQAMADSLLALLPGSTRDRIGNVTLTLGRGAPKRLVFCSLDEIGYAVGNITDDGYVTLRRVGGGARLYALFDQQLEGHRVTLFGRRGPVPGVVGVRSTHLTRGRPAAPEPPFTVDNASVDVGARSRDEVRALGVEILTPVSLTKRPHRYGDRLLAAPNAGRRSACAALAAAALSRPRVRGTVVVAFTVQSLYADTAGLKTVTNLQGPFESAREAQVPSKFAPTAVETVSLTDVEALVRELVEWMGGGQ
jgi:putative aminopeptidase FrvX